MNKKILTVNDLKDIDYYVNKLIDNNGQIIIYLNYDDDYQFKLIYAPFKNDYGYIISDYAYQDINNILHSEDCVIHKNIGDMYNYYINIITQFIQLKNTVTIYY